MDIAHRARNEKYIRGAHWATGSADILGCPSPISEMYVNVCFIMMDAA